MAKVFRKYITGGAIAGTLTLFHLLAPTSLTAQTPPAESYDMGVAVETIIRPVEPESLIKSDSARELPRTETLCYESEAEALTRSKEHSLYIQPLKDNWKKSDEKGRAVYTSTFKVPFAWAGREHFLRLVPPAPGCEIYINGNRAGFTRDASGISEFDITRHCKENVLNEIKIITLASDGIPEIGGRSGNMATVSAGSPSDVMIVSQPRARIRDFVYDITTDGFQALIQLGVVVKTHLLNARDVRIHYKLLDPDGNEAATGYRDARTADRTEDTVRFLAVVKEPRLWSHESPNVYTLLLRTQHSGRFTEYIPYDLGIRTLTHDYEGFKINSHPVELSAAPFTFSGDSISTAAELTRIKSEGYNTLLPTHPMPPHFYASCNRIGLYVIPQAGIDTYAYETSITEEANPSNDPLFWNLFRSRTETSYFTTRNNPSVAAFSLARDSGNGYNLYKAFTLIKSHGELRPVIYLGAGGEWNTDIQSFTNAPPRLETVSPTYELNPSGDVTIRNNARATTLRGEIRYTVKQGVKKIDSGSVPVNIEPQSTEVITIPAPATKPGKKLKYEIEPHWNL